MDSKQVIDALDQLRVINNPDHPHFGKTGKLTGKVIRTVVGTSMAEFKFEGDTACGVDACYVTPNDVAAVPDHRPFITRHSKEADHG